MPTLGRVGLGSRSGQCDWTASKRAQANQALIRSPRDDIFTVPAVATGGRLGTPPFRPPARGSVDLARRHQAGPGGSCSR